MGNIKKPSSSLAWEIMGRRGEKKRRVKLSDVCFSIFPCSNSGSVNDEVLLCKSPWQGAVASDLQLRLKAILQSFLTPTGPM